MGEEAQDGISQRLSSISYSRSSGASLTRSTATDTFSPDGFMSFTTILSP